MRSSAGGASWGLSAAAWAVVAFLHVPLALIILYAFSAEDKSYVFPPPALTTCSRTDLSALRLSRSFNCCTDVTALPFTAVTRSPGDTP